jgi:hypothetical protein
MKLVLLPLLLFSLGCASQYSAKDGATTPKTSKKTSRYSKRVPAQQSGDNSLLSRFRNSVNFESGTYLPENDPTESCYDGEIELLEIDDTISVMIGGRLIISDIKMTNHRFTFNETGCKNQVQVSRNGNIIVRDHTKKCPSDRFVMKASIEFNGPRIKYEQYVSRNGTVQVQLSCELVKRGDD